MFLSDPFIFTLSLLDTAAILFLLVYYWSVPKFGAHMFITTLLILNGHWVLVLINLPMVLWLGYELLTVPTGNTGIYDPTEIHNRGQLKKHMSFCMVYLFYYLIMFFIYLYCLIIALLEVDPLLSSDEDALLMEL